MSHTDSPVDPTVYDARELTEAALGFLGNVAAAADLDAESLAFRVGWTPERYKAWEKDLDHASLTEYHTFLRIAVTAAVTKRSEARKESGGSSSDEPQGRPAREDGGPRQTPTELSPGFRLGFPYEDNSAGFVAEQGSTPADLMTQFLRFLELNLMGMTELARQDPTLGPPLAKILRRWTSWIDEASTPAASV